MRSLVAIDEFAEYANSQILWIPDGTRHGGSSFKDSRLRSREVYWKFRAFNGREDGQGDGAEFVHVAALELDPRVSELEDQAHAACQPVQLGDDEDAAVLPAVLDRLL